MFYDGYDLGWTLAAKKGPCQDDDSFFFSGCVQFGVQRFMPKIRDCCQSASLLLRALRLCVIVGRAHLAIGGGGRGGAHLPTNTNTHI